MTIQLRSEIFVKRFYLPILHRLRVFQIGINGPFHFRSSINRWCIALYFFAHSVFAISRLRSLVDFVRREAFIMHNVDMITALRWLKRIRMMHVRTPITRYRDLHFVILCNVSKLTKFHYSYKFLFSEKFCTFITFLWKFHLSLLL